MKHRVIIASVLAAALSAFAVGGALGQHDEHHPQNHTTQEPSKPGTDMMGMMSQMTSHHQKMTTLMNKLMDSMKAIETEKDPAALKLKLAEHRALLEQMHAEMMRQGGMMQNMSRQMHKMMSDNKGTTK